MNKSKSNIRFKSLVEDEKILTWISNLLFNYFFRLNSLRNHIEKQEVSPIFFNLVLLYCLIVTHSNHSWTKYSCLLSLGQKFCLAYLRFKYWSNCLCSIKLMWASICMRISEEQHVHGDWTPKYPKFTAEHLLVLHPHRCCLFTVWFVIAISVLLWFTVQCSDKQGCADPQHQLKCNNTGDNHKLTRKVIQRCVCVFVTN